VRAGLRRHPRPLAAAWSANGVQGAQQESSAGNTKQDNSTEVPQGRGAGPDCRHYASPGRLPRAQAYKQNKEMLPKAAFQFGLKAGDGRKSSKDLTRKQDNKLSGQLRKIQARAVTSGAGLEGSLLLGAERAGRLRTRERVHFACRNRHLGNLGGTSASSASMRSLRLGPGVRASFWLALSRVLALSTGGAGEGRQGLQPGVQRFGGRWRRRRRRQGWRPGRQEAADLMRFCACASLASLFCLGLYSVHLRVLLCRWNCGAVCHWCGAGAAGAARVR
jgi:hypothetical protein